MIKDFIRSNLWWLIIIPLIIFAFSTVGGLMGATLYYQEETVTIIPGVAITFRIFNLKEYITNQVWEMNIAVTQSNWGRIPSTPTYYGFSGSEALNWFTNLSKNISNTLIYIVNWLIYIINMLSFAPKMIFGAVYAIVNLLCTVITQGNTTMKGIWEFLTLSINYIPYR